MPLLAAARPPDRRAARSRRLVVGAELGLGLFLGAVGGWLIGLLRVRRP